MPTPNRPSTGPARRGSTVVIGLLGGIASGKSSVARLLAGERGVVLDADRIARAVLESPEILARLRAGFGPAVLRADGSPDRKAIARLVFADPGARRRIEGWIHPRVRERIWAGLAEARAAGRGPVVLDVPLLLENDAQHGLASECDFLVFVEAGAQLREQRAAASRGWKPGEVARRESTQMPLTSKRARARHVIENRGDFRDLEEAVRRVLELEGLR